MRLFLILSVAALLLAAGCANNRPGNGGLAPSSQARLGDPNSGWSVPPGQTHVTDPQPAGAAPSARAGMAQQPAPSAAAMNPAAPVDEAAMAEAERRQREDAAREARARLHPTQPADATAQAAQLQDLPPAVEQSPAQAAPQERVTPIVPAVPVRVETERVSALRTVHFAFDDVELNAQARAMLEENARWMKANPEVVVQVAGHADERGTPEYNLALGERRAKRVREFLIEQGVPADNMVTASYGEEMPIATGRTEAAWSQNRRTEFSKAEGRQVSSMATRPASG